MKLFLIGYRGTGKSTVARLVARQLDCSWVDADELLEAEAGKSIRAIFEDEGEEGFRARETQVLLQLAGRREGVVALGGGAVLREENRRLLRTAPVVWLTAQPETILQRLAGDPTTVQRRPNLTAAGGEQEVRALLAARLPYYQECADFAVSTDAKSPDQVAQEIVCLLNSRPEQAS